MLHCAALTGNTQIMMMLLQCGADVMALTDVRSVVCCRVYCSYQEADIHLFT